jgi:hypothetical protein
MKTLFAYFARFNSRLAGSLNPNGLSLHLIVPIYIAAIVLSPLILVIQICNLGIYVVAKVRAGLSTQAKGGMKVR